ncbi:hypothetical protein GJAV_G00084820 [Gymnothorax javanicus]|nr:hypothetical protein GJAV_G00084820 [Gymnothorax javanicus]
MAQCRGSQACSVPYCSNSKKKQPYLSFHSFPTDEELRRRWILAIRRNEGAGFTIRKGCTFVCAMHFEDGDIATHKESGRKHLTNQAVPTRFMWNNWGRRKIKETAILKKSVSDGVEISEGKRGPGAALWDHDYSWCPPAGALDEALERIRELEDMVLRLTFSGPLLDRWCVSDEDFRYFTRFPSKHSFCLFWKFIEPSASNIFYWSKARRAAVNNFVREDRKRRPSRQLLPVDEFFMFCLRVASGLVERVLAEVFQMSSSTVSRIIITWSNYLYLLLGSIPIWMTRGQVRGSMPVKFRRFCPNVRVIFDCAEIRCEIPEALALHSEKFSTYKSYTAFKALIGVAPCGAVTFASRLFIGSISDKELMKQSGILELLEPEDEVIADEDLLIEKQLENVGAKLIIPPLKHKSQVSGEETEKTQAIATLRILAQRVVRRIKEFHIWDSPVPLHLAGRMNQIWTFCCLMANYQGLLDLEGKAE